ncbi:AT-hook motif nuclear-localized protein 23-like [Humulus lupulus]|uniref:AT-hook motif nuclear-localized protein 23-like n=1 Tax=Humulus lupulus TaxID=3486 RepID=UPI002B411967|nr:AT-hook motif nuclear-localized protein 23-like [Humulus lupulus]
MRDLKNVKVASNDSRDMLPVQEDAKRELAEELSKIKVAESEDFTKPVYFPFHVNRNGHFNVDDDDDDDDNNNFEPHSGGGFDLISSHHQSSGDMASRCPRGRPPGSMNKPKSSMIITRESANTLWAHILEVGSGCNVFDFVATYARKRQRGICVLSGSGIVTNITFWQLTVARVVVTLHGWFEIIFLSGSFLPSPAPPGATNLTVFLAGGQGQVVGGNVVGALIAADPTIVIASSFTNVAYDSFFVTFYSFHVMQYIILTT